MSAGKKSDIQTQMAVVAHYASTGNYVETGKAFDIAHTTVINYVAKNPEMYALAEQVVKTKILTALDAFILEALTGPDGVLSDTVRLQKAGLRDIMVAVGIAIDKARQIKGEATVRIAVDVSPEVMAASDAILEALSKLPKDVLDEITDAEFEILNEDPPATSSPPAGPTANLPALTSL